MKIEFTQEDYELSKVIFQNMLEMFRSKHTDTAIDERALRDFAGFYCWCVVTGRGRVMSDTKIINTLPLPLPLPYDKIMTILENGLDSYFGNDIAWTKRENLNRGPFPNCYPYTPSSMLGRMTYLKNTTERSPNEFDSHGYTISQKLEKYKKEYGIK